MKNIIFFLLTLHVCIAQNIKGHIPQQAGKGIRIIGYDGFTQKTLANATADNSGNFDLQYPANYRGSALLSLQDNNGLLVLLNNENFEINWVDSQNFNNLTFNHSLENNNFKEGSRLFAEADGKTAGLSYLLKLYEQETDKKQWLNSELIVQQNIYNNFLKTIPSAAVAKNYLSYRKLLANIRAAANGNADLIAQVQHDFLDLDFNHPDLWHSELYKQLLDDYFLLTENVGSVETIFKNTENAANIIITKLKDNPEKQRETAAYLFNLFENKSLFEPAERLALRMLNDYASNLEEKQIFLFEKYRKLANGQTAPDILLENNEKLSQLTNPFKLVVFGASWCPYCTEELPKLKTAYSVLKDKYKLEVIYVSIDTDRNAYNHFLKNSGFISVFGGNGWDTKAAKDYFIFSTPTMLLLDTDNKILTKIKSIPHLEAWLQTTKK